VVDEASRFPGTPSDEVPKILAAGRPNVVTIYQSLSARHSKGLDEAYLRWHALDHEPEQHRLMTVWASRRYVSTPACRAGRAVSDERYDAIDYVMSYLFAAPVDFDGWVALQGALRAAGRDVSRVPILERGLYRVQGKVAAPGTTVGADVLPRRPATGLYLLIERGPTPSGALAEVSGVAGVWWGVGEQSHPLFATTDNTGLQITYCYLDDDPVEVATRMRPFLDARWASTDAVPLLAAPFYTVVPFDWGRHLP
jgi:hypothetical protein